MSAVAQVEIQEELALMPTGFRLLIRLQAVSRRTDAGIYKTDRTVDAEQLTCVIGEIVAIGPDAYKDEKRYPSGPWCKLGDWVLFREFAGRRLILGEPGKEREYRILHDDLVEAVVRKPEEVKRP